MTRNVDQLRSIQTFEELIPFLEDDLDWPFPHGSQDYEFDDLTFEYTPEELGLEEEFAAKIKRIHQLRPLVGGQPWGIFFVEFENKKLPVVVLRRILSHLVLKQRKSANPADRARWNAGDLLFISAFAEEGTLQREIAFAHFHQDPGDQPTLRVLGWDGGDTPLKLEHVSQLLKQRLSWPRNPADHAAWRKQWAGAFRYKIGEQIRTADLLARELARVARNIRDAAMALMKVESSRGPLRRMHEAFRTALIHDLTQEGFADTYAQTITYGLLTAAISRTDRSAGADGTFVLAEDIHNMVPITNPFLKEMLESFLKVGGRGTSKQPGLDFDELGVQEVVELLRSSDIDLPAVLEDFGNRNPGEDPVIRFYEDFLKAYNKELKIKRGVFYTPQPVVSYMVRSVHELLQTEFGLPDGLASTITWGEMVSQMNGRDESLTIPEGTSGDSPFIVVLDPATGTATFLVEVIQVIFETLTKKWTASRLTRPQQAEEWNRYVPADLLPRLFGYELMMAPYAIAHMKIGLKLHETGYTFGSEERVRVYLTNALEPPSSAEQMALADWVPALAHEARAVNTVKQFQQFTVVTGNPPYALLSANMEPQHRALIDRYKFVNGVRIRERGALQLEKNLNDDYVKFIRFTQMLITRAGVGVWGLITNHSFLDNPTMRGMRWSLLDCASRLWLFDLHGNSTKKEQSPDGSEDLNVFQIKQGVAISLMVRLPESIEENTQPEVKHFELWGNRERKEDWLRSNGIGSHGWTNVEPTPELNLFVPQSASLKAEFETWSRLPDVMSLNGAGYITARDNLVIDFDHDVLLARIAKFSASTVGDQELLEIFEIADKKGWDVKRARAELKRVDIPSRVIKTNYRPFDSRWIFFDSTLVWGRSWPTMQHVVGHPTNLTMLATRLTKDQWDVWVATTVSSHKALSAYDTNSIFPLWLFDDPNAKQHSLTKGQRRLNINLDFLRALAERLGVRQEGADNLPAGISGEDIFSYAYAVLRSSEYGLRYLDLLKSDFPRLPLAATPSLFHALSRQGNELISVHLMQASASAKGLFAYEGSENPGVEKIAYSSTTVWIDRAETIGFRNVPESVWSFKVGGYQVCEKWLKDRKGAILSITDIDHYCQILNAISETLVITARINEIIESHGGWPGAFA